MAIFAINTTIDTKEPLIEVTHNERAPLKPGRHRFQLVVVDDSKNISRPDIVEVIVADQEAPTAVLVAPGVVGAGTSFPLNGEKSFDVGGGQIVGYRWTYLGPA